MARTREALDLDGTFVRNKDLYGSEFFRKLWNIFHVEHKPNLNVVHFITKFATITYIHQENCTYYKIFKEFLFRGNMYVHFVLI